MEEQNTFEAEEILNILGQGGNEQRIKPWMKKVVVKNNQAKASELFVCPEQVFGNVEWKKFNCIKERKNWIYKDKKRTDEYDSISYTCQTANGELTLKCNSKKLLFPDGFFDQDLDEIEESTWIRVRVGQARITEYKVEYGMSSLSIVVDEVERVSE